MSCFRTFIALALFLGASSAFAQVGEISDKRDARKLPSSRRNPLTALRIRPPTLQRCSTSLKRKRRKWTFFPKRSFYIA